MWVASSTQSPGFCSECVSLAPSSLLFLKTSRSTTVLKLFNIDHVALADHFRDTMAVLQKCNAAFGCTRPQRVRCQSVKGICHDSQWTD